MKLSEGKKTANHRTFLLNLVTNTTALPASGRFSVHLEYKHNIDWAVGFCFVFFWGGMGGGGGRGSYLARVWGCLFVCLQVF